MGCYFFRSLGGFSLIVLGDKLLLALVSICCVHFFSLFLKSFEIYFNEFDDFLYGVKNFAINSTSKKGFLHFEHNLLSSSTLELYDIARRNLMFGFIHNVILPSGFSNSEDSIITGAGVLVQNELMCGDLDVNHFYSFNFASSTSFYRTYFLLMQGAGNDRDLTASST